MSSKDVSNILEIYIEIIYMSRSNGGTGRIDVCHYGQAQAVTSGTLGKIASNLPKQPFLLVLSAS
jgi:hypothetical protein